MFGGAITHSTAHLLLEDDTKNTLHEVLEDMFTSKGANFNSIRIPIGSSDSIVKNTSSLVVIRKAQLMIC